MARATRFEAEQLGFETEAEKGETFGQFATREGTGWSLRSVPPGAVGVETMLYVEVEDVDEAYRRWIDRGGG